jgi:CTP:molybdopterin cytidylyltransferase MocA
MIHGIILSAGASERMGTPKALLDYRGETFVARLVRVLGSACGSVTAVLGHHIEDIRPHVPNRARIAINPAPERGQLSSLQTGLAEIPAEASGFAFIPVDCPAVDEETVQRLARAFADRGPDTLFVIPRKRNKRGHPVFAARAIADEMLALAPTAEAREIVHRHVSRTQYVEVEDEGIFTDIDTPDEYRSLK